MKRLKSTFTALAVLVGLGGLHGAAAAADDSSQSATTEAPAILWTDVHDDYASFRVDPAKVMAIGQIPPRWELQLDDAGRATVYMSTWKAKATINGLTETVTNTNLLAVLDAEKIPYPERSHDNSDVLDNKSGYYILSWATSSANVASWFRAGTGLGSTVQHVPGLDFAFTPGLLVDRVDLVAPNPIESPFTFTQTLTKSFVPIPGSFRPNLWRETPAGTFRLDDDGTSPEAKVGQFVNWRLTTDPSTPLGQLIGGSTASATCGVQGPNPLEPLLVSVTGQNQSGCVSAHIGPVVYKKELIEK